MQQTKLLLLGSFIIMLAGCSDHGHSHDDNSQDNSQDQAPRKHDSIN